MNRFTTSPSQVCRDLPAWDAFNRLSMADDLKVKPSGTVLRYAYDTGNRRVAKVTLDVSASSTINDLYLYGGWQVLEERRTDTLETGASSTIHRQFVYGNYIDEPLVMDTNEDSDGDCLGTQDYRLFYHTNTLFSVYALTDTDGNVIEAYAYDPYGKHVVIKDGDSDGKVEFGPSDSRTVMGTSNFDNPYTFTGRRYDSDTGLHYYRLRQYSSFGARFLSRDPFNYFDGMNMYQYVNGIPSGMVDPFGGWTITNKVNIDFGYIKNMNQKKYKKKYGWIFFELGEMVSETNSYSMLRHDFSVKFFTRTPAVETTVEGKKVFAEPPEGQCGYQNVSGVYELHRNEFGAKARPLWKSESQTAWAARETGGDKCVQCYNVVVSYAYFTKRPIHGFIPYVIGEGINTRVPIVGDIVAEVIEQMDEAISINQSKNDNNLYHILYVSRICADGKKGVFVSELTDVKEEQNGGAFGDGFKRYQPYYIKTTPYTSHGYRITIDDDYPGKNVFWNT